MVYFQIQTSYAHAESHTVEHFIEYYQQRSQPDNLVMLCKFKSSLFISLEIDFFYSL